MDITNLSTIARRLRTAWAIRQFASGALPAPLPNIGPMRFERRASTVRNVATTWLVLAMACLMSSHVVFAAVAGNPLPVHVQETGNNYATVADALADSNTLAGMTVRLAAGTYSGSITLSKGVKLVGATQVTSVAGPSTNAGVTSPPVTIIDGGNSAANGIVVANGVVGASISGFEIRNFTSHCVVANYANDGLIVEESLIHHCGSRGISVSGIAPGGISNVTFRHNEVHATADRAIVVWDGIKRDITITDNWVHDLTACCGIELQDGAATGVTVTDNVVGNTGDSGMAFIQLTSGSPSNRPNTIARNTVSNTGRFGIEIKLPNGTGAESGDGAIVIEDNSIVASVAAGNPRDRAGIAVMRRSYAPGSYPFEVDATSGVIVRNNNVSGFTNANAGYEGYGIVIEGLNSSVSGNTLANNGIGLQIQQGNPDGLPPGDSNQSALSAWFGRGNAPSTCISVGSGIDQNSFTGNALDQREIPLGTPMIGARVLNETTNQRYCSINVAIAAAQPGDVLSADAGTYAEDVVINKAVTLRGAKAGENAGVGTVRDASSGESVIVPAIAEAGMSLGSTGKAVLEITSSNVTLDGFVIDADNPLLTSGAALNGANPDVSTGMSVEGQGLTLQNLIVRNATYAGIVGYATTGASGGNLIINNRFNNITSPSPWGRGLILAQNFYAQVTGNLMDQVRVGVQTNNYSQASPGAFAPSISGNEIHATRSGIFHNLFYQSATTWTITNNAIHAAVNPAQSGEWSGLWVESMQSAQTVTISGNAIDAAGLGRPSVAYLLNNIVSSLAGSTAIDGGSVSNVAIGVRSTDATFYTGPVDGFIVRNVAFSNVALGALYVEDTIEESGSASLTVGAGNSYANVAHRLVIAGAAPVVTYAAGETGSAEVFVRSAGTYIHGVPASNSILYTTANALINTGIALASTAGTVNVEGGTFVQNVIVNKSIVLRGPQAGVAGDHPSRGSVEAILSPASGNALKILSNNVSVDGISIQNVNDNAIVSGGNFGGASSNVQILNNRVLDVQAGSAIYTNGPYPAATNWTIEHNYVRNVVSNVGSGINYWAAAGGRVADNHVEQSGFAGIQAVNSQNVQILRNTINATADSGINVGTTNPGAVADAIIISGNVLSNTNTSASSAAGGMKISSGASNITLSCNTVGGSGTVGFITGSGAATPGVKIFHNSITTALSISHNQGAGINIGSNWYGGNSVNVGGSNAAGILVADALSANPIGNPACGNNTSAQVVAVSGNGQSTPISTAFSQSLVARLQDTLGGAVVGQPVELVANAVSGATAALGTNSGSSDYNGVFGSTATANNTAGSYTVSAHSAVLHLDFGLSNAPGAATITLDAGTLNAVYDNSAHAVTATTVPSLAYTVTYNGGATAPINAGTYVVVATITNPNYSGSASGLLVIDKAPASVAITNITQVFNGSPRPVTVATTPLGLGTFVTYAGSATAPSAVGNYSVLATVADANHVGSANAVLQILAADAPDLAVSITDNTGFVQYTKLLTYVITVSNVGNTAISGASISNTLPPELDVAAATWTCIPIGGATCTANGSPSLNDTVSLPVGADVVYLLTAQVLDDPLAATDLIINQVSVNAAGDVNPKNNMGTDATQVVIFRNGIEEGENGAERPESGAGGTLEILSGETTLDLDLARAWAGDNSMVTVAQARSVSGVTFRVEAIRVNSQWNVRLVAADENGEAASDWSRLAPEQSGLVLGMMQAGSSAQLLLVGAAEDLQLPLASAEAFTVHIGSGTP